MLKTAPLPDDEPERLAALRSYGILDTPAEKAFDRLTLLAAQICDAPIAVLSFVDHDRQWFKSEVGISLRQFGRLNAFCSYAIMNEQVFLVPDALADERFKDHPLVSAPPHVRSFAAAPLCTPDGFKIGNLCVMHDEVRQLSEHQIAQLQGLADIVVDELLLRQALADVTSTRRRLELQAAEMKAAVNKLEVLAKRMSDLVGERQQLHAKVDRTRRFLEKLVQTVPVAIFSRDAQRTITHANPAYAELIGLDLDQILGRPVHEILTPEQIEEIVGQDMEMSASPSGHGIYEFQLQDRRDGTLRHIIGHKAIIRADDGSLEGVVGALVDITEQNTLRDQLKSMAETDPLTGAANRRAFFKRAEEELERSVRYGHPLSIIMIDIDNFKTINDTNGHHAGDKTLCRISSLCSNAIRQSIDLFARVGGEEFAILAPEIDEMGAAALAERLRSEIAAEPFPCAAKAVDLTASFGVVSIEAGSGLCCVEEALKRADKCLYRSKQGGRNRVTLYRDLAGRPAEGSKDAAGQSAMAVSYSLK